MFAVIYSIEVKPDKEDEFIEGWEGLTKIIREHCGGLGSRLHKTDNPNEFIAYAQWPSEEQFDNPSPSSLPPETESFRKMMKNSCIKSSTLYKMDMINDLLLDID